MFFLGVPPSGDEFTRSLVFLFIAIAYAGAWLGMAMLFSVLFRSPATAALLALGVWLFMSLLWPIAFRFKPPIDSVDLFPGMVIPMHFFPALSWYTLKPFFFRK